MENQQILYTFLRTQIQFGTYNLGDRLPTIEDASHLFLVSNDTIRNVYRLLRNNGFVSMSKSVGVKVKVQYSEQERDCFIQNFLSQHQDVLMDLGHSVKPLFSCAQWLAFKNASPDLLEQMEQIALRKDVPLPYSMIQLLHLTFGSLHNDLLMRLVWQIFLVYQAPFLSIPECTITFSLNGNPVLNLIALCREKDWKALRYAIEEFQEMFSDSLRLVYNNRSTVSPAKEQTGFTWSAYKKASQLCYSLATEILIGISRNKYPAGTLLPPMDKLAAEYHVSVSTVRRALSVLNSIGAVRSINGLGTRILSLNEMSDNCDLTQPSIWKHLSNQAESLHILALSCKEVSKITIASASPADIEQFRERMCLLKRVRRYELAAFGIIELITHFAPHKAIRVIYKELFQQLLWCYPLRKSKSAEPPESYYLPCLDYLLECLNRSDAENFSAKLQELIFHDHEFVAEYLSIVHTKVKS